MSAQIADPLTMLEIKPTRDLPRLLRIVANATTDYLSVSMCAPKDRTRHLSFACAKRARCHVQLADTFQALHIGDAFFEVTPQQAAEIQRTFSLREYA